MTMASPASATQRVPVRGVVRSRLVARWDEDHVQPRLPHNRRRVHDGSANDEPGRIWARIRLDLPRSRAPGRLGHRPARSDADRWRRRSDAIGHIDTVKLSRICSAAQQETRGPASTRGAARGGDHDAFAAPRPRCAGASRRRSAAHAARPRVARDACRTPSSEPGAICPACAISTGSSLAVSTHDERLSRYLRVDDTVRSRSSSRRCEMSTGLDIAGTVDGSSVPRRRARRGPIPHGERWSSCTSTSGCRCRRRGSACHPARTAKSRLHRALVPCARLKASRTSDRRDALVDGGQVSMTSERRYEASPSRSAGDLAVSPRPHYVDEVLEITHTDTRRPDLDVPRSVVARPAAVARACRSERSRSGSIADRALLDPRDHCRRSSTSGRHIGHCRPFGFASNGRIAYDRER